jgi:cytochrome c556
VRPRRAWAPALALVLTLAGCGGATSMSAHQLRADATRACAVATQRLDAVSTPKLPSDAAAFLRGGIAALQPELEGLAALHPDGELGKQLERARSATQQELAALQSSLKGLRTGNDPIVAIKTLQAQLLPLEKRATAAWLSLNIPACVDT